MNIKINDFDGPLDLLWHLIKAHKMDIYDINIEKITKEYLSFINEHKELTIDGASEYLVMASELIHLKSKLLLNKNDEGYIPRLLNNLEQYTLICNTSNPQIGGEMVEIFSYPLQVTTSLVVEFNSCCKGMCRYEKSQMKEGKKCN